MKATPAPDPEQDGLFRQLEQIQSRLEPGADFEWAVTLSGREANNLFWNLEGQRYLDLSGLSGIDEEGDGRVLVLWDYDRDGRTDIAVVNANAPRLRLFRNVVSRTGDDSPGDSLGDSSGDDFLAVRLEGGEGSPRDACGARVELLAGNGRQTRELYCGEGFAGQNSKTLHFGLGTTSLDSKVRSSLTVHWPSGRTQVVSDIEPGRLITVIEGRETRIDARISPLRVNGDEAARPPDPSSRSGAEP